MSRFGTHFRRGVGQAPRPPPEGEGVAAPGIPPRPSLPAAATGALTRKRAKNGPLARGEPTGGPRSVRARPSGLKGADASLRDSLRLPLTPETSASPYGQHAGRRGLPFFSRGAGAAFAGQGQDWLTQSTRKRCPAVRKESRSDSVVFFQQHLRNSPRVSHGELSRQPLFALHSLLRHSPFREKQLTRRHTV